MNDQSVIKLDKVSEYMLKIHSLNFHFQGSRAGVMEDLSHTMPTFHIYKKHMHNYRKQPKVFGWRFILTLQDAHALEQISPKGLYWNRKQCPFHGSSTSFLRKVGSWMIKRHSVWEVWFLFDWN